MTWKYICINTDTHIKKVFEQRNRQCRCAFFENYLDSYFRWVNFHKKGGTPIQLYS